MKLNIPIKGIQGEIRENALIIRSDVPLKTLSSAVLNGGMHDARAIINQHVPKNYNHADPEDLLKETAKRMNLFPAQVVGLMTSVNMNNTAAVALKAHGLTVNAIVTAGLSNPARAGDTLSSHLKGPGTINVILLIDGNLTESCMMDAAKMATESKSIALEELDIRSQFSSKRASGTTTDSIVVASTARGKIIEYAGTATKLGEMIGTSVKKAVKEAIKRQEGITSDRLLTQRLMDRGITLDDLINTALELFLPHPGVESRERASKLLEEEFDQALSDVNVAALVMAGLRLEEDGQCGLIPGLRDRTFKKDPKLLVADEVLGMAIANYIAGSRGVFEYIRFDRAKPGILKNLGPVADDVIGGLIGGVSSKIYTRARERR